MNASICRYFCKPLLLSLVCLFIVTPGFGQSYKDFITRFKQQYQEDEQVRPCDSLIYVPTILGTSSSFGSLTPSEIRNGFFDLLSQQPLVMAYSWAYNQDKTALFMNHNDNLNLEEVQRSCFLTRKKALQRRKNATLFPPSNPECHEFSLLEYLRRHPEIEFLFEIMDVQGWDYSLFWGIAGDKIYALPYDRLSRSCLQFEAGDYLQNIAGDDVLGYLPLGDDIFRFCPYHYITHVDQLIKIPIIRDVKPISSEEVINFDWENAPSELDTLSSNDAHFLNDILIKTLAPNDVYNGQSYTSAIRYYGTVLHSGQLRDHIYYIKSSVLDAFLFVFRETDGHIRSVLEIAHRISKLKFVDCHLLRPVSLAPDSIILEETPKVTAPPHKVHRVENHACYHTITYNFQGYIEDFNLSDTIPTVPSITYN